MLLRPDSRDKTVIALFDNYVHFVKTVENTPTGLINRSHEWARGFHAAIGLSGEAGEIEQLFKKDMFGKNKSIQRSDIVNELGDLLWYFVLMQLAFNISLQELIEFNTAKLAQRYAEKLGGATGAIAIDNTVHNTEQEQAQKIVDVVSTYLPDEEQDKLKALITEALGGKDGRIDHLHDSPIHNMEGE